MSEQWISDEAWNAAVAPPTGTQSVEDCRHDGPIKTDVIRVGDAVIASTACLVCGHILGTGSDS